jgi:two-component system, chemotaxis family, CheB/CheR fusion protein
MIQAPNNQPNDQFEALLVYLREARGFDFTGYKRSSLMRRVNRRMTQAGVSDYFDYLDLLQVRPNEFTALFNTILINVTGFFRDPDAWSHLRDEVLAPALAQKPPGSTIRAWSAGCASGEEAYTLAMILAELTGDEFRDRVKIYATDVDEESLALARQGTYSERAVESVPAELRERYFEVGPTGYTFRKDLRRSIIFGRNDLVQDAPISRIDLLVCRNALMYFNAETQSRIISRFHFALADTGVLFLGKAEMLLSHAQLFLPLDLKRRTFVKVPREPRAQQAALTQNAAEQARHNAGPLDELRNEAFLTSSGAQVVITADGLVALTNRQAEVLFGTSSRDVGRPFRELDLSYRPVELRRHIDQTQMERRPQRITDIEYIRPNGERLILDVQLTPLVDSDDGLLGISLNFVDMTAARRLQDELEQAHRRLETAYEELQSANEELETTNEELHSTVEELETTNEELQSTNEELETMNEELHSTNDELQNINDQLRESTAELDAANVFLEAILTSLRAGVAVLNQELQVQLWNRRAEDMWGLRREEAVGQHFLNLDIGLPLEPLRPMIRKVLAGGDGGRGESQELLVAAVNRRGRSIMVRVLCTGLYGRTGTSTGAIMVMEEDQAEQPLVEPFSAGS